MYGQNVLVKNKTVIDDGEDIKYKNSYLQLCGGNTVERSFYHH